MDLYLARDGNGTLALYREKPVRGRKSKVFYTGIKHGYHASDWLELSKDSFPEVTWENSPVKVTLSLLAKIEDKGNSDEEKVNPIMSRGLHEFGLSVRAMYCLEMAGVHTVGDLVQWHRSDLLKLRNFGMHTIHEIDDFLIDHNLTYGMEVQPNLYVYGGGKETEQWCHDHGLRYLDEFINIKRAGMKK